MICIEPQKKIPVLATCEVLVVGGGPAGLSAALGARRAGADVILCEAYGCFGGVITQVETVPFYFRHICRDIRRYFVFYIEIKTNQFYVRLEWKQLLGIAMRAV